MQMLRMYAFVLLISVLSTFFIHSTNGQSSVKELSITSSVSIRYANVLVRSLVQNLEDTDNEFSFQVRIPRGAFITNFVIISGDKTIRASIEEKSMASKVYDEAKKDGASAGTVTQQTNVRDDVDRDIFDVKVNVAAQTTLEFRLEYEELIQKKAGKYVQRIFVDSDRIIPKLEVKCEFKEKQKFKQLTYQTPGNKRAHIYQEEVTNDGYFVKKINWKPSVTEQAIASGLEEPFEIEYELEQSENGGTVYMNDDGEFVHMFSTPCEESKIMRKEIVFVIDISGSMQRTPIAQVRQTMEEVLPMLRPGDYFNIVIFNDSPIMWKQTFQHASQNNIELAKQFVDKKVVAKGSTNINDALLKALGLFSGESEFDGNDRNGQIVVFLTDGSPTVGVIDRNQIRRNIRSMNYYDGIKCCRSSIYTIAFGTKADISFLNILAHEHAGKLTVIRETNQDGELLEVYHGLETPYLKNLNFIYTAGNKIVPKANMTRSHLRQYDCSEEFVVAGWTFPREDIVPLVKANGLHENVTFKSVPIVRTRNVTAKTLSRLLIYQRVQQLLRDSETATDPYRIRIAKEQALNLSLQYGFVTPLTSLVVTDYSPKGQAAVANDNNNRMLSGSGSGNVNPISRFGFANGDKVNTANVPTTSVSYEEVETFFDSNIGINKNAAGKSSYSFNMVLILLVKVIYLVIKLVN